MSRASVLLVALLAISLLAVLVTPSAHAQTRVITIAVDLAHGESDKYLGFIQGNITSVTIDGVVYPVRWINITPGTTITPELLSEVDILLIGQPTVSFTPDEMEAIKSWLYSGNKVLYVAGDSDYGATGPLSIEAVNSLLEYIGVRLRLEHAAVYTPYPEMRTYVYKGVEYPTNALAYYRVLAFVEPDNVPYLHTYMVDEEVTKPIIMHGPTCVIWVDEEGIYRDPVAETYPGLVRLVWFRRAYIGNNNPPDPYVYDILLYGLGAERGDWSFVAYAAEYIPHVNSLVTVAGESLYGNYEPAWSSSYIGVDLDGPRFVTNLVRWWVRIITMQVLSFEDPVDDDKGPGTLKYPTNPVFVPGAFDIVKFQVLEDGDYIYLRTTFRDYGGNPWGGPNGLSLQLIHVYILTTDPTIPKNYTAPGLNVNVYHGWHYLAVAAPGWGGVPWPDGEAGALYASDGTLLSGEDGVHFDVYYVGDNSIDIRISKNLLKDVQNVEGWIFAVAVASFDGFGPMRVRQVVPGDPQEWLLGGGDPRAILAGVQPLVVDFLAPTAEEQYTLLSLYDPDTGRLAIIAGMSKYGFMGPLILRVTVEVPVEVTVTIAQVVTETLIETKVLTETVTVTVPEYTTAAVVGVVAIVIIAVLVYMLFKRK
ncbi:MAG: glucodextranase DOMON-like domain-containing protein [Desulfurococcaceae archaeon]